MLTLPSVADRDAFYAAALAGLRELDARERAPRRFGPDADTRWAAFRGGLNDADRIDILLRDAAVLWGAAFAPVEVFGLFGLAPDEAFGPDWIQPSASVARRLLQESSSSRIPADAAHLLGVSSSPPTLPTITPATRLAVAGGAALLAVAEAFAGRSELVWSKQVLAVATTPSHRQLAGLLAVLIGADARTSLARPEGELRAILKGAGFTQLDIAVTSADAEPECATFCRTAAGVA